ncbi:MAG: amidohydrolase [Thermoguttaceae bacterium]|nr:amidohydrolase [Thermoguttaceae bacterium]MDW8078378.1 amidohydrolase family protein [Thermoguttaceae bacterium]
MPDCITRRRLLATAVGQSAFALFAVDIARASSGAEPSAGRPPIIVDSHVHLKHGDAARTEYSARAIVEVMDAVGIHRSVVFAMSTTTQRSIEMARQAAEEFPGRLIPYVYALPHYERPVIREIEAALDTGLFRGIKIHAGECTLAEYVVDPVLKLAGRRGVPCLIDCLGNVGVARRMAESFPDTRLIVAHMGRYLARDEKLVDQFIELAERHPNVFLDTSGVVLVRKITEAVSRLGSGRLIWGTDGPHPQPDLVAFARAELEKIRSLPITDEDKARILGRNILELLKL